MQREEARNNLHIGINLLLQGDDSGAKDIWMPVLVEGMVQNVEDWPRELVQLLEINCIQQLQSGNFRTARICYLTALEIDENYKNEVLETILLWPEQYLLHCEARDYQFTVDWFGQNILVWQQFLQRFTCLPDLAFLEIGSWEGRSTCWILDNILTHKSSTITCVDTFEGSIEHKKLNKHFLSSLKSIFDYNINQTGRANQVKKIVGKSQEILRQLPLDMYDFLYIDGSHLAPDVLEDALLGWRLVKVGGIIIFDDYEWPVEPPTYAPKLAVDAFLNVFADKIKLVYKGYQVIIEKIDS